MTRRRSLRSGGILAAALVCLLIVMMLSATLARSMVARERFARLDNRRVQCALLAESAASRAAAKYQRDSTYAGESWTVTVPTLQGALAGRAEIAIEPIAANDTRRRATIVAYWPDVPLDRMTHRIEMILPPPPTGEVP